VIVVGEFGSGWGRVGGSWTPQCVTDRRSGVGVGYGMHEIILMVIYRLTGFDTS